MENKPEEQEPHQNPDGEPEPQDGEENEEGLTPEEVADLRKKADVSSQNFERAKKAEEKAKQLEKELAEKKEAPGLSTTDLYALVEAKVPKEDVAEVQKMAKALEIDITKALNEPIVKARLAELAEKRATEQATIIKNPRGQMHKETADSILSRAEKGQVGEDEVEKLAAARMESRLKR